MHMQHLLSWTTNSVIAYSCHKPSPFLFFSFICLICSSIVWSTSVTQSRRLCGLSDEAFLSELNTALQHPSEVDRWSPLNTASQVGEWFDIILCNGSTWFHIHCLTKMSAIAAHLLFTVIPFCYCYYSYDYNHYHSNSYHCNTFHWSFVYFF
jgi:hypothetical protein